MSNVLSQEEVDSLLKGVSSGEIETEPDSPESEDGVIAYDFTRQEQMLRNRMPSIGMVTERFPCLSLQVSTSFALIPSWDRASLSLTGVWFLV